MTSPAPELTSWLRVNLDLAGGAILGQGYQASVRLLDSPFGRIVVKSAHRGALRGALSRRSISNERKAYERLAGVAGVPMSFGLLDREHLILEYIPGPSLRSAEPADRDRFFGALLETLQAMHAAGVAHGDLKRKENTLVGPAGRPYVIDFGVACLRRSEGGFINRLWFDWLKQMDYNAWIKLKYGRKPIGLSAEDAARYRPLRLERMARWVRIPWQKLTLRRLRQRWRRGHPSQ